jgi:serine/threonine protein kinase
VLPPGTKIDQYVVEHVLGRGGFGITYLVRDQGLDTDFALKEFFPEDLVLREDTSLRFAAKPNSDAVYKWGLRKFYDEARLLAQFNHGNIVNVRRVFEANRISSRGARWRSGCRAWTARRRSKSSI